MIRFVTARGHGYTLKNVAATLGRTRCAVWHYDRLFRRRGLPDGTWVFTDHERLSPYELRLAAAVADRLVAGGAVVLNHPARVRCRAELLGALRRAGINDFSVWRAEDAPRPDAFPVFIRNDYDHDAPRPELVRSQAELDNRLAHLVSMGTPLRGLLVVQYRGEEIHPDMFRKLAAFRVGESIVAHHHVVDFGWVAKWTSDVDRLIRSEHFDRLIAEEHAFVRENGYEDILRKAFEIARIDYGRADFSIVGGRPQIYEINTNPDIPLEKRSITPERTETLRLADGRLVDALRQIDVAGGSRRIAIRDPVLEPHQTLRAALAVSRWRP